MTSSQQALAARKIIHCDADCFFAAIEMRDDPTLRGRPIAIGGAADRRGVIATCNYEARAYGVRSAMATAHARRLCPDLLVIPGNMAKYRVAAQQIRHIFLQYTDLVEPLSLDEAYLDVTASSACRGSATLIAEDIRRRVKALVGITVSAGVAPNKFLAKVGSDWQKPDGLTVIPPQRVKHFVRELPVARIHGVGKVTAKKLQQLGIVNCGDLQKLDLYTLGEQFGSFGLRLYEMSRGIDERPVQLSRQRKSVSVEHTYAEDITTLQACKNELPALFASLQQRIDKLGDDCRIHKQFVKLKFSNFQSTTMESIHPGKPELALFESLCQQSLQRGDGLPIRLLGVGVRIQSSEQRWLQMPLI